MQLRSAPFFLWRRSELIKRVHDIKAVVPSPNGLGDAFLARSHVDRPLQAAQGRGALEIQEPWAAARLRLRLGTKAPRLT